LITLLGVSAAGADGFSEFSDAALLFCGCFLSSSIDWGVEGTWAAPRAAVMLGMLVAVPFFETGGGGVTSCTPFGE
jgi:hypothetical protein